MDTDKLCEVMLLFFTVSGDESWKLVDIGRNYLQKMSSGGGSHDKLWEQK